MLGPRTYGTLLLILATALPAGAQTAPTTQRDDYASTSGARGIAIADLNGDGWPDIAEALHDPDGIEILTSKGAGGGYTSSFMALGAGPFDLAAGDLNNDGAVDLVVADPDSSKMFLLYGLGHGGGFRPPLGLSVGGDPRAVALADLNRDGRLDIILTLYSTNRIVIYYGNDGGGVTLAASSPATGTNPQGVAVADFNQDGLLDLVVACSGSVGLSIYYQGTSGTFTRQDIANVPTSENVVATGDFNRDGRPDIAAASTNSSEVTIFVNGRGFTSTLVYSSGGNSPRGIAVADLNRDGIPDVIVANRGTSTVDVLMGRGNGIFGDGTYTGAVGYAAGSGSRTVAAADLNGDGRIDIVTGNEFSATATVLSNTTSFPKAAYAFSRQHLGPVDFGYGTAYLAVADFDKDGKPDIATTGATTSIAVLFGNMTSLGLNGRNIGPSGLAAADFTRDGNTDILSIDTVDGFTDFSHLHVFKGDGAGHFPSEADTQTNLFVHGARQADVNRDGRPDLVVTGTPQWSAGTPHVQVYLGNGDGTFTLAQDFTTTVFLLALADIDGDGDADLVLGGGLNPAHIDLWRNDGTGRFTVQAQSVAVPGWQGIYGVAFGDVNRDGYVDMVGSGYSPSGTNQYGIFPGSASGFTAPTFVSGDPGAFAVADVTLDGKLDIVTNGGLIFAGDGGGGFAAPAEFDYFGEQLEVLDFNGDGLPDIVITSNMGASDVLLNQRRDTNLSPTVDAERDWTFGYRQQFGEEAIELVAQGSDPDVHRLTYRWTDETGRVLSNGRNSYVDLPVFDPGAHTLTVEVTDGRGGSARDSMVLTILPEKEIVIHPGSPVYEFDGKAVGSWSWVDDATAADGKAAHDVNANAPKVTAPSASPSSYSEVTFIADTTQTYKLWVRLKAEGNSFSNDSVWLQLTNAVDNTGRSIAPGTASGVEVVLEECSGCGDAGWGWRDEAWGQRGAIGTMTIRFTKGGAQTLRLQTREDGVFVDQVVLSSEKYTATRPGAVKNDNTILQKQIY